MSIIEFIRDRARYYNCPVCGRNLKGCELRMLTHADERYTVQVTCAACHVTFIVVLAIQGPGLEPVAEEIELDLGAADLEPARSELQPPLPGMELEGEYRGPIQSDELLDVHLILKEFSGSFKDLLREPDRSRG